MKKRRRLFGILLAAVMLLTMIPMGTFAVEETAEPAPAEEAVAEAVENADVVSEDAAEEYVVGEYAAEETTTEEAVPAESPAEAAAEEEAVEFAVKKAPLLRAAKGSPRAVDVDITKFEIQTLTYSTPESIWYNDTFYLAMDWDATALGTDIHEGDYFDIKLPDNMRFPADTTARIFNITDSDGNVIAVANVTPGPRDIGGNLRVTFTDAVEEKYDVKGSIYLAAKFNREAITTGQTNTFSIVVNSDVAGGSHTSQTSVIITGPKELENEYIGKWGQAVSFQPEVAEWHVRLNHTKANLTNVVFTDTLGSSGETYIQDSFILQKAVFDAYGNVVSAQRVDTTDILRFSDDGSSFTLDLGNVPGDQYRLIYRSTYTPGSVLRNEGIIHSNEIERTFRARHISAESGGSGGGSLAGRIRIIKVDEDDVSIVLANAVFLVTARDGSTFTMTTGADGVVTSGILHQGVYTVEEITPPDGYEIIPGEGRFTMEVSAAGGAVRRVKNRKASKVDVPVTKAWDDANNQDGIRPASVTVKLLADGADTGKTLVLNDANNWSGTFTELDEYVNGRKINYTIEELDVSGYVSVVGGDAAGGYTVTNTHTPEETEVSGAKTWDDADNQDGVRPESITVRLHANGTEVDSRTVTAADNWAWTFTGLPKYENGTEIVYSVTEDVVDGYSTTYQGYDVVNTHTPGKTSLSVVKAWDDANNQDGIRPASVTVKLLADGADTGKTLVLNDANNWSGTFTELDEYVNGRKINYTIEELDVSGYVSVVGGDAAGGYTVTNTHTPEETEVSGAKIWDDADNQDGVRPESITVRLHANGTEVDSRTVTAADNWAWTFTGLPKYENGTEIVYSVTEDVVDGYSTTYQGYDVVNTHTPGKTSLSVVKAWDDANNQDGIRPESIIVQLLADNTATGETLVLNDANNWSGTFTELDEYKNGRKIVYTIEESPVEGYIKVVTGDQAAGYTITNIHTPEETEVSGAKTWDDADNQDGVRPESITVRLHANGTEVDSRTVTAADNWAWTFTGLPKYESGTEIVYSVTEDAVDGYATTYEGFDVINQHTPEQTSVSVTKAWNDVDNKDGSRPASVTIRLLANGNDTGKTLVLSADNNWTGSFTELDVNENGERIVYTIAEDDVAGYTVTITGDAETGFTVTNSHTPEEPPKTPEPPTGPKTGDDNNIALFAGLMALSLIFIVFLLARRRKRSR